MEGGDAGRSEDMARAVAEKVGSLCSGITYGAGASIYHQEDSLYRPNYLGNWHPERWQTSLHEQYFPLVDASPFLWGWFVANMFDYGAAGRDWGEGTGIDDRGLVTFDRKYRKDAFYFYKANWNKAEPMVYIAQKRWTPARENDPDDPGLFECSGSGTAGQRRFARQEDGGQRGVPVGKRRTQTRRERARGA